jgi:hypothetical protein
VPIFGRLFGAARQELELAKVLNLYFGTFYRLFSEFGLERVLGTIKRIDNLEISFDDDRMMGFYIRAEDLKCFYFRLIKKGGNGPAVVASGSGPYNGFSVSADLATGKMEVWCKPTHGTTPTAQGYELAKTLKQKFGAVEI